MKRFALGLLISLCYAYASGQDISCVWNATTEKYDCTVTIPVFVDGTDTSDLKHIYIDSSAAISLAKAQTIYERSASFLDSITATMGGNSLKFLGSNDSTVINADGTITGTFYGDGSNLTGISTTDTSIYNHDGTLAGKRTVTMGSDSVVFTGTNSIYLRPDGAISANAYYGDGSNLTGISDVNIYNDDGTLAGARAVTMGGYTLDFSGSPNLTRINAAGQLLVGDNAGSGYTLLGGSSGDAIELGTSRTADGASVLDFWSSSATSDYDLRFIKNSGLSGTAQIINKAGQLWIQNTGSDPMIFRTNATERMRIEGGGNVGIGTTSPGADLQIDDTVVELRLRDEDSATSIASRLMFMNSAGESGRVGYNASADLNITNQETTGGLRFLTQNTERMRVTSAGNVGINTTAPTVPLEVDGQSIFGGPSIGPYNASIKVLSNNDAANWARLNFQNVNAPGLGIIYQEQTGDFTIRNDATGADAIKFLQGTTERMRINTTDGYVGIGTSSPATLFHVQDGITRLQADGVAMQILNQYSTNGNTIAGTTSYYRRYTAGNGANGIGAREQWLLEDDSGADQLAFLKDIVLIDATAASEDSEVRFHTYENGVSKLTQRWSAGSVRFDQYGTGSKTGTAAYMLAVDASGNVIEEENRHDISIQVVNRTTEVATGESEAYFVVGIEHDGLTCTHVEHRADSGTGSFDLQIRKNDTLQGSAITVNGITSIETDIADFTIAKGDVIDANISAVTTAGINGLTITISCK